MLHVLFCDLFAFKHNTLPTAIIVASLNVCTSHTVNTLTVDVLISSDPAHVGLPPPEHHLVSQQDIIHYICIYVQIVRGH